MEWKPFNTGTVANMCAASNLVWFLISKYFVNLTSVLIIHNSSSSSSSSTSEINRVFVEAAQSSFENLTRQGYAIGLHWMNVAGLRNQSSFNDLLLQHVDMGIQGYITILASIVGFLYARWYATENSVLRLKDKYYLFLSEDESPKDVLTQEILKLYPQHLFVSARSYPELELWTQRFVGDKDNLDAVHLDTFLGNRTFARNVELYPNKLLDMQGRTLAVASITYIPYVASYFVPEQHGDVDCVEREQPKKNVLYRGSEADIVKSFCKLRNCTIKVMPYGKDNWGGIYENGSSNGMIGSVFRGETEFGIGCYYNWYNDIFETSIAIAKSAVTILAPAPSRYPAYMTNILPFGKLIWTLIILSIVASSCVMHGIKYFSFQMKYRHRHRRPHFKHCTTYQLTLLEMVAIFFQQSFSSTKLNHFAARFFLSSLLLAAITLENTYSGQLKSLLTIPLFTEPVDTINKFARTDWKWGAPAPAWVLTVAKSDIGFEQIMTKKFEIRGYSELRNASFRGNYGLAVERLHGGTYSFGDYIRDGALNQLILSKDDLFFDWTRSFSVRGWPLMEAFNTHILWCLEHGLYHFWERKHGLILLDKKVQETLLSLASGHLEKFPPTTLSIANISGPLMALGFGYTMAFLVFLLELFGERIKDLFLKK